MLLLGLLFLGHPRRERLLRLLRHFRLLFRLLGLLRLFRLLRLCGQGEVHLLQVGLDGLVGRQEHSLAGTNKRDRGKQRGNQKATPSTEGNNEEIRMQHHDLGKKKTCHTEHRGHTQTANVTMKSCETEDAHTAMRQKARKAMLRRGNTGASLSPHRGSCRTGHAGLAASRSAQDNATQLSSEPNTNMPN